MIQTYTIPTELLELLGAVTGVDIQDNGTLKTALERAVYIIQQRYGRGMWQK